MLLMRCFCFVWWNLVFVACLRELTNTLSHVTSKPVYLWSVPKMLSSLWLALSQIVWNLLHTSDSERREVTTSVQTSKQTQMCAKKAGVAILVLNTHSLPFFFFYAVPCPIESGTEIFSYHVSLMAASCWNGLLSLQSQFICSVMAIHLKCT